MKKIILILVGLLLVVSSLMAQVPQAITFQAIARDIDSEILVNTPIMIQLTILDGGVDGTNVYQEIRSITTNNYGSFAFQIGVDPYMHTGAFDAIEWKTGNKYLKVDYDPSATLSFDLSLGTIEFVTVPYAFATGSVSYIDITGVANGDVLVYNDITQRFEPEQGNCTPDWEDVQNKPDFATVATSGDYADLSNTPSNVSQFANDANYLTSFTETDPVFTAWDKSTGVSITESQISDFGTYLTSFTEVDGSITNEIQTLSISGNNLSINGTGGNTVILPASSSGSVPVYTTPEIDALMPAVGDVLFNTTENLYQIFDGTVWQSFNTNCWPLPTEANARCSPSF